jgi:hypothetical protein
MLATEQLYSIVFVATNKRAPVKFLWLLSMDAVFWNFIIVLCAA